MKNGNGANLDEIYRLVGLEETTQRVVKDLRIRLSSVIRHASLIRAESREISTLKHVEMLYLEALNASRMLDNVISGGRNHEAPSADVADANGILMQTISLFSYQLKAKGILLDTMLAEVALPVNTDPVRLQQAFYIGLLNAVQLQIGAGREKRITITSRIDGETVRVGIVSDVPSMVMKEEEDPIEQFYKTLEKGMGTGWYTLKKNIAEYGGSVSVESGERFTITIALPLAVSGAVPVRSGYDSDLWRSEQGQAVQRSVLIIDDEELMGCVTSEMMSHLGYEAVYADSPVTALPLLRDRRFDIVMVDYQMPKMNGVEFIKEHGPLLGDAHIILMSGFDALDASVVTHDRKVSVLKKPFALKELTCLVQEMKP